MYSTRHQQQQSLFSFHFSVLHHFQDCFGLSLFCILGFRSKRKSQDKMNDKLLRSCLCKKRGYYITMRQSIADFECHCEFLNVSLHTFFENLLYTNSLWINLFFCFLGNLESHWCLKKILFFLLSALVNCVKDGFATNYLWGLDCLLCLDIDQVFR